MIIRYWESLVVSEDVKYIIGSHGAQEELDRSLELTPRQQFWLQLTHPGFNPIIGLNSALDDTTLINELMQLRESSE